MATIDLRFWDGSEWVSVGDVAADKVVLPVPSADGTVVLDSPAADTFSIETGGAERLRVMDDGTILVGTAVKGLQGAALARGLHLHSSTTTAEIKLTNSDTGAGAAAGLALSFGGKDVTFNNREDGTLAFRTKNIERMRFTGSGAVAVVGQSDLGDPGLVFLTDLDTGIQNVGDDKISFVCGGSTSVIVDRNGRIQAGLGSAAEPSVSFIADADTGTFSPGAGNWAVSTNGTERLRVDADGHVGIGTAPATTVGLWISQKISGSSVASIITTAQIDSAVATAAYIRVRFDLMAGAAVGNLRGFSVDSQSFAGSATDVYGYYCETLPAGTDQTWAFYAATNKSYFGGQIQTRVGTAAEPSVSIFGDTDTGAFSPAADTWAVSTGGVERLRADNFGIDVKAPAASNSITRIRMRGSDSKDYLTFTAYTDGYASGIPLGMSAPCSYIGPVNGQLGIAAPDEIRFGIGSTVEVVMSATGTVFSSPGVFGASGGTSAANPAIYFAGSSTSGFYAPAEDTIAVSTGGEERLRVDATKIHAKTYVDFFDPAEDLAGRLQATSTTFYVQSLGASRNIVFRQSGVDALTITSTQDVNIWQSIRAASGTASAPGFAIRGDEDTGTFSPASDTWAVSCGGVERLRVSSTGITLTDSYQAETGAVYGFYSAINKSATNSSTYQFLAGGNAPSQFNGQVLLASGGPTAPGIANRSNPATGIDFTNDSFLFYGSGIERLRVTSTGDLLAATGYTPANPQSLATKAYVDGNASSSGAVTLYQVVTPSEYAALTEYDPHVMYLVTENDQTAPPVDQDNALAHTIVTRTEFDALPTKDEHTIYIIKG